MSKPGCEYYWFLHGCRPEPSKEIIGYNPEREAYRKSIGNHFSSKEEAEKAVEKLKALKRLRDRGFKFKDWYRDICEVTISAEIHDDGTMGMINDLDLLLGGEE